LRRARRYASADAWRCRETRCYGTNRQRRDSGTPPAGGHYPQPVLPAVLAFTQRHGRLRLAHGGQGDALRQRRRSERTLRPSKKIREEPLLRH
jgi:hypothetical protein